MNPIKVGLAGIGRAGWYMHCEELDKRRDKFTIVAACDVEPERRARMAERYACRTYADFSEMAHDPDVELLSIAVRSPEHVPYAITALQAGKHVFLEKPVALNVAGSLQLRDAAATARGKLFFRHNRRFEPAFTHITEIIQSGLLGDVFEVKLRRNGYQRRGDWQTLMACGGGQLNNWGPHIVDHALQLLGAPVADQWSDLKCVAALGDAEDHLKIVLRGTNGCVVDMEISGGAALPEPEYIIFGQRGALICLGDDIMLKYLQPGFIPPDEKSSPDTPPLEYSFGEGGELPWVQETIKVQPAVPCDMDDIWDHLYAALREGKPYPITTEQALEVVRVIEVAKRGTRFQAV